MWTCRRIGVIGAVVAAAGCLPTVPYPPGATPTDGAVATDRGSCAPGALSCGGQCVNPAVDPRNCGGCGRACDASQECFAGSCQRACGPGQVHVAGGCQVACPTGQTACTGACRDLASDGANCGGCGRTCAATQRCLLGVCAVPARARSMPFQITALAADGCAAVEHAAVTGADHGGLVVGAAGAYYTGAFATAVFGLDGLAVVRRTPQEAALASNLRDGTVYALANGTQRVVEGGGTVTSLIVVDAAPGAGPMAGPAVGSVIPLSATLLVGPGTGIFSGWDRVAIHTGAEVYDIELPLGRVRDLGQLPAPVHQPCAAWAYWGVAEEFEGSLVLDYVRDRTTIARLRMSDGASQALATFTDLGDMCGFGIAPEAHRWYFHHHGASQFRVGDETLGRCSAAWTQPPVPDRYTRTTPPADAGWVEACDAPGHTNSLVNTDDGSVLLPLPFGLRYWDVTLAPGALVNVSSNGWLGLNGMANAALTGQIPTGVNGPRAVVAAHWGDLVTRARGVCVATVGAAPARRWVAEWSDAFYCCGDTRGEHLTFEVAIDEATGAIDLLYQTLVNGRPLTVGIENDDASDWLAVCNAGVPCEVAAGTAIRFQAPPR